MIYFIENDYLHYSTSCIASETYLSLIRFIAGYGKWESIILIYETLE